MLNKGLTYKGKNSSWSSILLLKTRELAFYLTGKRKNLEFANPIYKVERDDSEELRQKVLDMSYSEWGRWDFSRVLCII
jgi:CRISPR-associated protein Cas1